jgi:uncharacterized linocin/CFP29 family protein
MAMGSLGRDKVWTTDIWSDIDKAMIADVGQVRLLQKVFPTVSADGAAQVPADLINFGNMTMAEGARAVIVEISMEFSLTQSQVDDEAALHSGRTLARLVAKSVALAADQLAFQGQSASIPKLIAVKNNAAMGRGLLALAANAIQVNRQDQQYPQIMVQKVAQGISTLVNAGQPGPYALLLETSAYADIHSTLANTLVMPSEPIAAMVTSGIYPSGALFVPKNGKGGALPAGLLVSLSGEPTVVYVGNDPTIAYTQTDTGGVSRFRVFERFQVVCRDPSSLVRFEFV